jgi:SAM-dependent methyltransferase
LIRVNPLKLLLWTFRRNPPDVIDLYNTLSPVMQLATGGDMLNFGFWQNGGAGDPLAAQRNLCDLVGEAALLGQSRQQQQMIIDIGSGLGAPAQHWMSKYSSLDVICININRQQLACSLTAASTADGGARPSCINATSQMLPFPDGCAEKIIALESAQHFRPLPEFIRECRRILVPGGVLALAIPVTALPLQGMAKLLRLGILSFTWSSEHYSADVVKSALASNGFSIRQLLSIGHQVYEPIAGYYLDHRPAIRGRILEQYPAFLEAVLHRSLLKMRDASKAGLIDYLVISAS